MFRTVCRSFTESAVHVTHRTTSIYPQHESLRVRVKTYNRSFKMSSLNGSKIDPADLPGKLAHVALSETGAAVSMDQSVPKSPKSANSKDIQKSSKDLKSANKPNKMHTDVSQGAPSTPIALPAFITERNQLFEELKKQNDEEMLQKPRSEIKITLNVRGNADALVIGRSWETTPGHLLRNVPKEVSADVVVAKVDGNLWDLDRPLERNCKISYLSSRDAEGQAVFWHSSAHVLGEAAENEYGCRLSHGPPTSMGFFYDMALGEGRAVKESDWAPLEAKAKKYAKDKQPFERLVVSKENLRKMFGYSKYKMHYIEKFVPDGEGSTVYRNGSLVDLCQGPHIQNTRKIEAFKIQKVRS